MKWHFSGQDVSVNINFLVNDEFVLPTSATYTVRKADGTVLDSGAITVTSSSEALVVTAANNALGVGNTFEYRFVSVVFIYNNETYDMTLSYGLMDFVPLTATPKDVRRELGLDDSELPNDEIDINQAYLTLAAIHSTSFTDAFTANDITMLSANRAVAIQAAIDVAESLPLRAFAMMRSEAAQVERFAGIDFSALVNQLKVKLANELEVTKNTSLTEPLLFELSTPTDVITNE